MDSTPETEMESKMKASDIPDELILNYLSQHQGRWTMLFGTEFSTLVKGTLIKNTIVPENTPHKVMLAKMRALCKRQLITGCDCGCRGDFEITDRGLALINKPRIAALR